MRKLISVIVLLVTALPLAASPWRLDLTTTVRMALERNPMLKQANAQVEEARWGVKQARANFLPQINLQGSRITDEKLRTITMPSFLDPTKTISTKLDFTYDYQLDYTFTQPLFTGGKLYYGQKLAKLNLASTSLQRKLQENEFIYRVVQSYLGVLVAQAFLQVAEEAYANASEFYLTAQQLNRQGMSSRFEVLQAEVQRANLLPRKIQAEHRVRMSLTTLRTLLALPDTVQLEITDTLVFRPYHYDLAALKREALQRRPELKRLELASDMVKAQMALVRADFLPSLALQASYSKFGNAPDPYSKWDDSYQIAVGLRFNLFSGGQTFTKLRQTRARYRQLEWSRKSLEDQIKLEVEQAYQQLEEAHKTLVSQEKTVEQAMEAYQLARVQFQEGTITSLQVQQAQVNLTTAKANRVQALFTYELAHLSIIKAVGRDLRSYFLTEGNRL